MSHIKCLKLTYLFPQWTFGATTQHIQQCWRRADKAGIAYANRIDDYIMDDITDAIAKAIIYAMANRLASLSLPLLLMTKWMIFKCFDEIIDAKLKIE